MSVIVEATIPADAFELGTILSVEGATTVTLETMVPLGERATPLVRVQDGARVSFEEQVRAHPSVGTIHEVDSGDGETLYALTWTPSEDTLFRALREMDATLLQASGGATAWDFQFRFPEHETLSVFKEFYTEQGMNVVVRRIYNPVDGEDGEHFGLTQPQRETLARAVEAGYYSLPREVSTAGLASEFGISDQAVTERLRRGIATLVQNTLLADGN